MTTFQDPPLQSRRSVRQNERDQAPAAVVPTTGPTPTPVAPPAAGEPLTYATQARPSTPEYDGPSFRARRTPEPVGDVPVDAAPQQEGTYRPRDFTPEGRRSASPAWAPQYGGAGQPPLTPAEPPVVPVDPASTFAPHEPAAPVIVDFDSDADSDEAVEHTLTRRELRALRDAHGITAATTGETVYPTPEPETAQPVAAAPVAQAPAAPVAPVLDVAAAPAAPVAEGTPLVAPSTRLDSALAEFDQLAAGRPATVPSDPPALRGRRAAPKAPDAPVEQPIAEQPVAERPIAEQPVAEQPIAEQPVAERPVAEQPVAELPVAEQPAVPELGAEASAAATHAGPAQISAEALGPQVQPVPLVEPPAAPTPEAEATQIATDGVAVFDALFSTPAEPIAAPQPEAQIRPEAQIQPVPPVEDEVEIPAAPQVQPDPPQAEVVVAEIVAQPVAPEAPHAPVEQVVEATIIEAEPAPAPATASEPSTVTPPTGHWSTQAQLDDETQIGNVGLARNIGSTSGAITTSALVLPSIPDHDFGPLTTGDGVMMTGSISLPASMSATGANPRQLDESDLDHLLDPGDHQVANTDSQPVRAIRAVSTHTSPGGVIGTVKPKGTRGLTALIIAATGMAVLVGALFIVLVVTGQLG